MEKAQPESEPLSGTYNLTPAQHVSLKTAAKKLGVQPEWGRLKYKTPATYPQTAQIKKPALKALLDFKKELDAAIPF